MKRITGILLIIYVSASPALFFAACHKTNDSANATIIGTDMRMCACCGGHFISIDGIKPEAGTYFLADTFPDGFIASSYPQRVYIEWEKLVSGCPNRIVIKKIIQSS